MPESLKEIKEQLTRLGISTDTPGVKGHERRELLANRLEEALLQQNPSSPLLKNDSGSSFTADVCSVEYGVPDLSNISMAELRSRLNMLGESTSTPGLSGDDRRKALIKRLMDSICGNDGGDDGGDDVVRKTFEQRLERAINAPTVDDTYPLNKQNLQTESVRETELSTEKEVEVEQEKKVEENRILERKRNSELGEAKKRLAALTNKRSKMISARFSGPMQDGRLREVVNRLSNLESESLRLQSVLSKELKKHPPNGGQVVAKASSPLVLDGKQMDIEKLLKKIDEVKSSCKEKIKWHKTRIRCEEENNEEYGVEAENAEQKNIEEISFEISKIKRQIDIAVGMAGKKTAARWDLRQKASAEHSPSNNSAAYKDNLDDVSDDATELKGLSTKGYIMGHEVVDSTCNDYESNKFIQMDGEPHMEDLKPSADHSFELELIQEPPRPPEPRQKKSGSFGAKAKRNDVESLESKRTSQEKRSNDLSTDDDVLAAQLEKLRMRSGLERKTSATTVEDSKQVSSSMKQKPKSSPEKTVLSISDKATSKTQPSKRKDSKVEKYRGEAEVKRMLSLNDDDLIKRTKELEMQMKKMSSEGKKKEDNMKGSRSARQEAKDTDESVSHVAAPSVVSPFDPEKSSKMYRNKNRPRKPEAENPCARMKGSVLPLASGESDDESSGGSDCSDDSKSEDVCGASKAYENDSHNISSLSKGDEPLARAMRTDESTVSDKSDEEKLRSSGERDRDPNTKNGEKELNSGVYDWQQKATGGRVSGSQSEGSTRGEEAPRGDDDDSEEESSSNAGCEREQPDGDNVDDEVKRLRLEASALEKEGSYDSAEATWLKALDLNPLDMKCLDSLATFLHRKRGELGRAEAFYRRAIQVCVPSVMDEIKSPRGNEDKADGAGWKSIAEGGAAGKVSVSVRKNANDNAEVHVDDHSGTNVRTVTQVLLHYATFLRRAKGDIEVADVVLRKAAEISPTDAVVLGTCAHHLVEDFMSQENVAFASNMFKQALKHDPSNINNFLWYAKLLHKTGKLAESELMFKVALQKTRGEGKMGAAATCNYAMFLYKYRNKVEDADVMFKEGLEKHPRHKGLMKSYKAMLRDMKSKKLRGVRNAGNENKTSSNDEGNPDEEYYEQVQKSNSNKTKANKSKRSKKREIKQNQPANVYSTTPDREDMRGNISADETPMCDVKSSGSPVDEHAMAHSNVDDLSTSSAINSGTAENDPSSSSALKGVENPSSQNESSPKCDDKLDSSRSSSSSSSRGRCRGLKAKLYNSVNAADTHRLPSEEDKDTSVELNTPVSTPFNEDDLVVKTNFESDSELPDDLDDEVNAPDTFTQELEKRGVITPFENKSEKSPKNKVEIDGGDVDSVNIHLVDVTCYDIYMFHIRSTHGESIEVDPANKISLYWTIKVYPDTYWEHETATQKVSDERNSAIWRFPADDQDIFEMKSSLHLCFLLFEATNDTLLGSAIFPGQDIVDVGLGGHEEVYEIDDEIICEDGVTVIGQLQAKIRYSRS